MFKPEMLKIMLDLIIILPGALIITALSLTSLIHLAFHV